MQVFVEALEKELTAEDIDTHIEGCIGCGNCGNACPWYLATNDPKYHPKTRSDLIRKIYYAYIDPIGKLKASLGLIEKPTVKDLEEMRDVFWSCTTCGRCSLACMQGVSNRRLTRIGRICYDAANILPDIVHKIRTNCRIYQHSFGLTRDQVFENVIQKNLIPHGIQVPIDVEGADYLVLFSAVDNTKVAPESAHTIMSVFNVATHLAGFKYTLSSRIIDTGTEAMAVVCNPEIQKQYLERIEAEIERLRVRSILIPECPCDIRLFLVDSAAVLGRNMKFPMDYADHLFYDWISSGKIPVEKLKVKVTYHDPCWTTRLTGYIEEPRELLKEIVDESNFIEMTPNREFNYCCNGGAGPLRMYPPNDGEMNLRQKVSQFKAKQIEITNADYVLTPCTTCFLTLRDIVKTYNLKTKASMLIDLVYEAMMLGLKKQGKENLVKFPAYYDKIPEQYRY
ncbi:MAG: (Fe-S)-binding protein, partial [Candidatus Altarchaeaceae archaeon]